MTATRQQIAVVGAGQMGSGIAQVCAQTGERSVILHDAQPAALEKAEQGLVRQLDRAVEKGRLSEAERDATLARIRFEPVFSTLETADIVIEAIIEDEGIKTRLFADLDALLPSHALIATNTSSLSITRLASATQRPSQVMGMHFMNPVPRMQLVELIRGAQTSDATCATIEALATQLGKTSVMARDFPGFIANRILMPLLNEAMFTLYEGVGSAQDIDTVMTLGMNHPMGPLSLADFIGLDTCLAIMTVLYEGFGDPKFRPCPLLKQYVDAGYLGRKTGRGFFTYDN